MRVKASGLATVRRIVFVAAAAIALGGHAAPASAEVYCVDVASTAGCDHVESPGGSAGLAAAVSAANATSTSDTIDAGAGTYDGPFDATPAGGSLTLTGAGSSGAGATTLTVTGDSQTVLTLGGAGSSASHLHLMIPDQTGDTGLNLNGGASDVVIDDPFGSTQAIGAEMDHPDSFTGMISLANGASSIAVDRTANGTGSETVSDSAITGVQAILATSGDWSLDHDRVVADDRGIQALDGTSQPAELDISDSLVRVTTSSCDSAVCFGLGVSGSSTITAERLTLFGDGDAVPGGWVLGAESAKTATLQIDSTLISGFASNLLCEQHSGGMAKVTADYSDFAGSVTTSGGCVAPEAGHNVTAPPDLVTGGFAPRWDSPLIDAGDPNTLFLPTNPTDLGGKPRLVDGNGDGSRVVDIGAFEYQRRPPSVTARTIANAPVGASVPFVVATASDPDPGDTLTFTWSFDDGGSGSGARVTHAFATAGIHSATVTATDPTGITATSTVAVAIVTRPPTPTPPPPSPKITGLRQSHTRWRLGSKPGTLARSRPRPPVGTVFSFTLNTAAKLTLTFTQSVAGRRVHHKCAARSRRNGGKPACRRSVVIGTLTFPGGRPGKNRITFQGRLSRHRRLAPGTYTLKITAKNATGKATSHAITFTIVNGNSATRS